MPRPALPSSRLPRLILSSLGLALAVSLGGCGAVAGGGPDPFSGAPQAEERGSPDLIIRAEVSQNQNTHPDAYLLIQRLRPRWLRTGAAVSLTDPNAGEPVVYLDRVRFGSLGNLRQIPSASIQQLEYFSATEATTRWGTGHMGGVIWIETTR